ncbi:adenosylmethionine--8-amino-7-oxononanoate transaminase [Rhodopirellula sp.]|nr:adenosylmethionine--8-amino-7-oxononanoate transaminase [Rhodopirellula sp.]MDB4678889.1 adenosylmethionine--8-amino-7-oxononanoate transaminase [Rhodopirellula sp.]MDC0295310.1 adenosylmethionine--8-amino-7-oxononanoate transaminase [bacterium]
MNSAHWHGFTQMAHYDPLVIRRAEGSWLTTVDGRRLLDGVASLWCNVHGHSREEINQAIRTQLDRVAHVTTLGMSCDTTEELASRLTLKTPGDLDHVFFSSDGSSAVEAAIKMAFQYWQQVDCGVGSSKVKYLALDLAYHGDTTGAVSLGGIKYFHKLFSPILFSPLRGPLPCTYRLPAGVSPDQACEVYASQLETIISGNRDELAAVVVEPLVQGAAGMITHPAGLLQQIRALCDRYDVLLICDEVATGFGRTGSFFACQQEEVTPDILCLGKGLTSGYLPMAATVARRKIFDAFLAPVEESRQFFHGHTFAGNPLAAAAALASLDLFESDQTLHSLSGKEKRLKQELACLDDHQNVGSVRGRGLMYGIEVVQDRESKSGFDSSKLIGRKICERATEKGVWIRPLGDVIVLMPPLAIQEDEIVMLAAAVVESIQEVTFDHS